LDQTCSSEAISILAENYLLSGETSIAQRCQHNAAVALSVGLQDIFHMWQMVQLLLDTSPAQDLIDKQHTQMLSDGTNEALSTAKAPPGISTSTIGNQMTAGDLGWLWPGALGDVVMQAAEAGDAQHAVAICQMVLSLKGSIECLGIPKKRVREWYLSYIEILQRLGLCQAANELINLSSDEVVRQQNAKSTTIYTACGRCRKPLIGPQSFWCTKCKASAGLCALCQQPCKGLYISCPGCSHGGHLNCLQEWFSYETACPAGCGHRCALSPPGVDDTSKHPDVNSAALVQPNEKYLSTIIRAMEESVLTTVDQGDDSEEEGIGNVEDAVTFKGGI